MEEQFKVGSVYVTVGGEAMRMEAFTGFSCFNGRPVARAILASEPDDWTDHAGARFLDDGRYVHAKDDLYQGDLIPGELQNVNGEWLPISVTAPVVEEKKEDETLINGLTAEETDATASVMGLVTKTPIADLRDLVKAQGMDGTWNSDAYMVGLFNGLELALATMEGREPQYRTLKPAAAPQVTSTAHPPINGLSLSPDRAGADHRLGGSFGSVAVHAPSVFRSSNF